MSVILSLFLSIVMAFSGAPAIPETMTTYTLSDIVLEVNGETIALNPSAALTVAPGGEQLQAGLDVFLENQAVINVAGELAADGLHFSLSDTGKVYSLSAETLDALAGISSDVENTELAGLTMAEELITEYKAIMEEAMVLSEDMEAAMVNSKLMLEHWASLSGVTPETYETEVYGKTIEATTAQLNLNYKDLFGAYDVILTGGTPEYQAYFQRLLDFMNKVSGTQNASFAAVMESMMTLTPENPETAAAELEEIKNLVIPMELTYGGDAELSFAEALVTMEIEEGVPMNMVVSTVYMGGGAEMQMNMTVADEEIEMGMEMALTYDGAGYFSGGMEIAVADADGTGANILISGEQVTDEEGLKTINAALNVHADTLNVSYSVDENGNETQTTEPQTTDVTLGFDAVEAFEADGSITAACNFVADMTDSAAEENVNVLVSYKLNRADQPFADAFEGREIVDLPADTEDAAYQQLTVEAMAPFSGVMSLSMDMDESVQQLMELFAAAEESAAIGVIGGADGPTSIYVAEPVPDVGYSVVTEDGEEAGYFIPADELLAGEYDLDEEYTYTDYTEYQFSAGDGGEFDAAAAAEAFGAELPALTLPEGYALSYAYVFEGYASLDYESESGYMSISISPVYDEMEEQVMILGADGTLAPAEGEAVKVTLNEDGSVLSFEFTLDGMNYYVYADSLSIEEIQQFITTLA